MIDYILNPEKITKKIFRGKRHERKLDEESNEERKRKCQELLSNEFNRLIKKDGRVKTKQLCNVASRPIVGRFLRKKMKNNEIVYKRKSNDAWYERV